MNEIVRTLDDRSLAFCVDPLRQWGVRPDPEDIRRALRDGRIRDPCATPWIMRADYLEQNPNAIEGLLSRRKE